MSRFSLRFSLASRSMAAEHRVESLDERALDTVVGGGSDDDNDDGYGNWGDTERNGHGYDMICPDPDAGGGMSWRYIGST